MSEDRLYDEAGRRVLTDDELAEAVEQYKIDRPGRSKLDYYGMEKRLRRLNQEARERQKDEWEAKKARTTADVLRRARAEKKAQDAVDRAALDMKAAREFLGGTGPAVRRPAGRPGWTQATFHAAYREARDRAGGLAALDKEIAAARPMSLKNFQALVRRFGRPA